MRKSKIKRNTKETRIALKLNIDGKGNCKSNTGIGFFDHMLTVMTKQSLFDVEISAQGDLETGQHHTVEDCGIVFGMAVKQALKNKAGIARYGFFALPMEDSLALVAVDFSGRGKLVMDSVLKDKYVEGFYANLSYDFFEALAANAGMTLQIRLLSGRDSHHDVESIFKGVGKALRIACSKDVRVKGIPSTKGIL